MRRQKVDKATYYRGIRMIPYDLVKELALALVGPMVTSSCDHRRQAQATPY